MAKIPRDGPISVRVVTLAQLFSGDYRFRLPWFQRAYAWRVDNVGLLLTNLREAMRLPPEKRRYWLGTILLAESKDHSADALVDGHQRIMTLTIIFAVLRDLMRDAGWKQRLNTFIAASDGRGGMVPHLVIDAELAGFVHDHVQRIDSLSSDPETDESYDALSETERNIIDNRDHVRSELGAGDVTDAYRQELATFLAEQCLLVIHELEDEEEAWQSLQIEEDTRLEFSAADRSKASIISAMPVTEREQAGRIWDDRQTLLGADDMRSLLGHVRNIAIRARSSAPVETELIKHYKLNKSGLAFMDAELAPMADRLLRVKSREIGNPGEEQAAIALAIEHSSWLDRPMWIAPALYWLGRRGDSGRETVAFFARLERLAWLLRIAGIDPSVQQTRMFRVLDDIDGDGPTQAMASLAIEDKIKHAAIANLRIKNFYAKHYSSSVLRRISVALGADAGPVDGTAVTIEHILPRKPAEGSQWLRDFGNRKPVKDYVNRLGNLAFLTEELNQEAAAKDYALKRAVFAKSEDRLARQVLAYDAWTPEAIEHRTRELTRVLLAAWDLTP